MCHTGSRSPYNLGDPIVEGLGRDGIHFGYGSTAGPLLDRHDGCPFSSQSVYEGDANKWRPVSLAAGQDSDAFDHGTFLIHRPHAVGHNFYENGVLYQVEGFDYPEVRVPLIIETTTSGSRPWSSPSTTGPPGRPSRTAGSIWPSRPR